MPTTRQRGAAPAQPKNTSAQAIAKLNQLIASSWAPLEMLLPGAECARFMFMGEVAGVHLYKHRETRRYLNVDESGATFAFNPATSNYDPISIELAFQAVAR
jgi:hypothetical protein